MKPREKVVSAEDVQSSLFYIHVGDDGDEALRARLLSEHPVRAEEENEKSRVNDSQAIPRRSIPANPLPGRQPFPRLPPNQTPSCRPRGNTQLHRKPVGEGQTSPERMHHCEPLSSPGHLSGPRPMHSRHRSEERPALGVIPKENVNMKRSVARSDLYPGEIENIAHDLNEDREYDRPPLPPRSAPPPYERNMTVIRRDPGTGDQWNVAKISELGYDQASTPSYHNKPDTYGGLGEGVSLHIYTPGYQRIAHRNTNQVVSGAGSTSRRCLNSPCDAPREGCDDEVFKRTIFLRPPKSPHVQELSRRPVSTGDISRITAPLPNSGLRRDSEQSIRRSNEEITRPYTFLSPWNGTCEFITGIAGRSLKCKHTLPSRQPMSKTISELRFNLPSSKVLGPKSSRPTLATSGDSKRASFFREKAHHKSYTNGDLDSSSSYHRYTSDEEDDKMDLSLGQELAGGGFSGKKAKLGKLIIEDEGQKMLDLVVAANMSVWWEAYERLTRV